MIKSKKKRLYLVSNMYPSDKNVRYGIFVKRFKEAIEDDYDVVNLVLTKKQGIIRKSLAYLGLYLRVIRLWFTAKKEDIIYVHFPLYFAPVLLPFTWRKITLVLNFHGSDVIFETYLKRFLANILRPSLRKSRVVVPSTYFKEELQKTFRTKVTHAVFVYPSGGVDSTVFYPKLTSSKTFVFGYISNFIENKGWATFIKALHILKESYEISDFSAIMIGDGVDLPKIEEHIKAIDVPITLMKSVQQEKLVDLYGTFDVFVFPTYRESLGLVGIEAMMCGKPVIASNVPGPNGYVVHKHNGYLVNKGDSKDLAKKMLTKQLSIHPDTDGFTFGLYERKWNGVSSINHGGDMLGYSSFMTLLPEENIGIFVVHHHEGTNLRHRAIETIIKHLVDQKPSIKNHKKIQQDITQFSGEYVWLSNCQTCPNSTNQKSWKLKANDDNTPSGFNRTFYQVGSLLFKSTDGKRTMSFKKDKKGKINYMSLGNINVFEKIK